MSGSRLLDQFATFGDLFMGILKIGEPNLAECFAMIGWSIWHKRNATSLQQASLPYFQVYSTAVSSLLEFFVVTDSQHSPKSVARPNSGIPLCLLVIRQILRTSQQQVSESLFGTVKGRSLGLCQKKLICLHQLMKLKLLPVEEL